MIDEARRLRLRLLATVFCRGLLRRALLGEGVFACALRPAAARLAALRRSRVWRGTPSGSRDRARAFHRRRRTCSAAGGHLPLGGWRVCSALSWRPLFSPALSSRRLSPPTLSRRLSSRALSSSLCAVSRRRRSRARRVRARLRGSPSARSSGRAPGPAPLRLPAARRSPCPRPCARSARARPHGRCRGTCPARSRPRASRSAAWQRRPRAWSS